MTITPVRRAISVSMTRMSDAPWQNVLAAAGFQPMGDKPPVVFKPSAEALELLSKPDIIAEPGGVHVFRQPDDWTKVQAWIPLDEFPGGFNPDATYSFEVRANGRSYKARSLRGVIDGELVLFRWIARPVEVPA